MRSAASRVAAVLAVILHCIAPDTLAWTFAGMRHLTQAGGSAPSCYWLERERVCLPSTLNMLAVPATTVPSNVFRRYAQHLPCSCCQERCSLSSMRRQQPDSSLCTKS
jgi:hypothetical protein